MSLIGLEEFLKAAFTPSQLHRLLATLGDGQALVDGLPPPEATSPNAYMHEAVLQLRRERALDTAFYDALTTARPRWAARVQEIAARLESTGSTPPKRIDVLLMVSEPVGQAWAWEEEARLVIKAVEAAAGQTIQADVHVWPRTTLADLAERLERHRPHVLHMIGTWSAKGVYLRDDRGYGVTMSDERFGDTVGRYRDRLRLVVLNGCGSHDVARRLATKVRHAVGWDGVVADHVAVAFGGAFYQGFLVGSPVGRCVENARDVALSQPGATGCRPLLTSAEEANADEESIADLW